MSRQNQNYDIAIIGGGLTGLCTALAIAHSVQGHNLSIALLDASVPDKLVSAKFDGRASAIAASNFRMLRALGVSSHLEGHIGPMSDILISDGAAGYAASPLSLHFGAQDYKNNQPSPEGLGKSERLETSENFEAMGYMIENRHLRRALLAQIKQHPSIDIIAPVKVTGSTANNTANNTGNSAANKAAMELSLEDGRRIFASLAIAADGRNSQMRRRANIEVTGWTYPQMSIVTTIAHSRPHNGVAHELFLPGGPLAVLPLAPDNEALHRSQIVWSDETRAAKAAAALPEEIFISELARRIGPEFGQIRQLIKPQIYPLGLQMAKSYMADRLVLIGDAAHAIHPIAGQGLNMGLRDGAALADIISSALAQGADIGGAATLENYGQWRRFDNQLLAAATDIFTRLFSNDIAPIKHGRRLGLAAIDRLRPAREFFIREAAGDIGDLPPLLR